MSTGAGEKAAQVHDDFFHAIMPMLIVNDGTLICMSTPFGKRGHFFEEWLGSNKDWKRIEITADKCPRITAEQLEAQKRSLGDMFFRIDFSYIPIADPIKGPFVQDRDFFIAADLGQFEDC